MNSSIDVNEPFDFDLWANTAKQDPEKFEAMRLQAIEQTITKAPEAFQGRLRSLQWRVDQERNLASSPMGACVRISKMMWERVSGDGGLLEKLEDLNQLGNAPENKVATELPENNIIPFNNCR